MNEWQLVLHILYRHTSMRPVTAVDHRHTVGSLSVRRRRCGRADIPAEPTDRTASDQETRREGETYPVQEGAAAVIPTIRPPDFGARVKCCVRARMSLALKQS